MKLSKKFWRLGFIFTLVIVGGWALRGASSPGEETVARQNALQALAPAGQHDLGIEEIIPDRPPRAVKPVTVNLKDIPANVYDPDNQLDRWQRGEIDLVENDNLRSAAEIRDLQRAAMKMPADRNLQRPSRLLSQAGPSVSLGFPSIDITECCGGGGSVPPDPELAVGPNHIIAAVNVSFEIYDVDTGNSLAGPTTFSSFMNSESNCNGVFDPNVIYDEKEDRFILAIDANGTHYCVAVSQTGDPLGAWNIYAISTGSGLFFDYPHAGVGEDAIFMGANMFDGGFLDSRVWAINKAKMYAGDPLQASDVIVQNLGEQS